MPTINIGRVRPNWMGEYSALTTYAVLDAVTYNGSSYIMKTVAPSSGYLPTNTTYWVLLAEKGDTGAAGPTGSTGPTGATGSFANTFETVSANLASHNPTFAYSAGNLSTVTYDIGGGQSIVKTFSYSGGNLSKIVLSGNTPSGINLTKTFTFDGSGNLTSIAYS